LLLLLPEDEEDFALVVDADADADGAATAVFDADVVEDSELDVLESPGLSAWARFL
jgi:hypothetical protein